MNDWLDYKGSGSSRAYMGDTISHKAFGIDGLYFTPADRIAEDNEKYRKQKEAETRLLNAKKEQLSSLETDLRNAQLNSEACSKKIVKLENEKKELDRNINELSAAYKNTRQTEPLKAHQMFSAKEYEFKKKAEALNDKITTEKQNWSKYSNLHSKLKSKKIALQQEITKLEKSLSRWSLLNSN